MLFDSSYSTKLIGVVSDYRNPGDDWLKKKELGGLYGIRNDYINAIETSCNNDDIAIVVIPYVEKNIKYYAKILDGILIPGYYYDFDPSLYNQEKHEKTVLNAEDRRVDFEFKFVKEFIKTNKPILGICHGAQLINILHGGSLVQDIPSHNNSTHHSGSNPKSVAHSVSIIDGTKLDKILFNDKINDKSINTNSSHHQSVLLPGKNIIVSAKSEDGIIEAIENSKHKFMIGVQWHPELLVTDYDKKIFKSFCKSVINIR
jgi:putative glutamine amidotransferase